MRSLTHDEHRALEAYAAACVSDDEAWEDGEDPFEAALIARGCLHLVTVRDEDDDVYERSEITPLGRLALSVARPEMSR